MTALALLMFACAAAMAVTIVWKTVVPQRSAVFEVYREWSLRADAHGPHARLLERPLRHKDQLRPTRSKPSDLNRMLKRRSLARGSAASASSTRDPNHLGSRSGAS